MLQRRLRTHQDRRHYRAGRGLGRLDLAEQQHEILGPQKKVVLKVGSGLASLELRWEAP